MERNKKILIIIVSLILLFAAIFGFQQIKKKSAYQKTDLYSVVSSRAVVILETKNLMALSKSLLYENDYWILTQRTKFLSDFNVLLKHIDLLYTKNKELQEKSDREALLVYNDASNDTIQTLKELIIIKITENEAEKCIEYIHDNIYQKQEIEKIKYKTTKINVFTNDAEIKFACAYINGIFLMSPYVEEVQKAIELVGVKSSLTENKFFMNVKETSGKNSLANIFVNVRKLAPYISNKINFEFPLLKNGVSNFTDWIGLDISISNDRLLVNGYSNVSSEYFMSLFKGQEPIESTLSQYLPFNTCFFTLYGISNYSLFKEKLNEKNTDITSETKFSSADKFVEEYFSGEVAVGYINSEQSLKGNSYVMLSIKDSTLTAEQLDILAKKTVNTSAFSPQPINIYELPSNFYISPSFGDFVKLNTAEYVTIMGQRMLIASSPALLLELSGQIISGYTLSKNNSFKFAQDSYNERLSVLTYVYFPSVIKYANEIFEKSFAEKLTKNSSILSQLQVVGSQMENERGMIYHNAFFKYGEIKEDTLPKKKGNRIIWQTEFYSTPAFGPVVLQNPATGKDEILIQDKKNKLYLYSHEGKTLWSIQLEAPIMGTEMSQIDFYKNKKYQFVFNTAKRIYIVDRKGRLVENYPIKLPSKATAPMSVFDYENNRDYRFAIPCENKKIYMYKKEGKTLSDWIFQHTKGMVTNSIQHVRLSDKDYLLVNDGIKAYILDRRGGERVKLQSDFQISKNNIFYLQQFSNKPFLLISDNQGYVKKIGFDGYVKSLKPSDKLSSNHYFISTQVSTPIVYIYVDDNKISVNNQDMKCIFIKHTEDKNLVPILADNQLAVYSETSNSVRVFDLKQLDVPEQSFITQSRPYIGKLKPMSRNYLVMYNNEKLICYELN